MKHKPCVIGVDVGGTNTDAVVLQGQSVIGFSKVVTTEDVTTGVVAAVHEALESSLKKEKQLLIQQVNIGTTLFVNAVIQRSESLCKVAVLRLATPPASQSTPPFSDFPLALKKVIEGGYEFLSGGFHVDGRSGGDIKEEELQASVENFIRKGVKNFVVCGLFSPTKNQQEIQVGKFLRNLGTCSFTLSYEIGHIGLIERENAAILNECLKPLCQKELPGLRSALTSELGLTCPIYLTKNDGTICSLDQALQFPVVTFASGPTNSMRGAAFISGMKSAVVVDIGGSSTDVGVLVDGFPQESLSQVTIAGVATNFRMPNTLSIALGGGSIINQDNETGHVTIAPKSVGYHLVSEAICFGGNTITATDVAVFAGLVPELSMSEANDKLDPELVQKALSLIRKLVEDTVDQMKTSSDEVDLILVGGGSILIDSQYPLIGCKETLTVKYSSVANAIGAALCQVSGHIDVALTADLSNETLRAKVIEDVKTQAVEKAIKNGAMKESVELVDFEEVPLAYLPGNAVRLKATAVGDLAVGGTSSDQILIESVPPLSSDTKIKKDQHSFEEKTELKTVNQLYDQKAVLPSQQSCTDGVGWWILNEVDVDCLTTGAGILGCGGGGSPHLGKLKLQHLIRQGKYPKVVSLDWTTKHRDLETPVIFSGFMGAPVVLYERSQTGQETAVAAQYLLYFLRNPDAKKKIAIENWQDSVYYCDHVEKNYPEISEKLPKLNECSCAVCDVEIGGLNSTDALVLSAETGILCLDADLMGRAFPELQMVTPLIYGQDVHMAVQASDEGRITIAFWTRDAKSLEDFFRKICQENGGAAGIVFHCGVNLKNAGDLCILGSVSRAWKLGKSVLEARKGKSSVFESVLSSGENGTVVFVGKVTDVHRKTEGAFTRGRMQLEGLGRFLKQYIKIEFQNENLVISDLLTKKILVSVPDLICLLETDSGKPVMTEELRYGLRVTVMILKPQYLLSSETALKVVGPKAFGYSHVDYVPAI